MKDAEAETLDWAFWFYWIMSTTLGWLTGRLLPGAMPVVVSGVAIAAFQWSVLYKRIHKAWRWLLLSSLGWIIGYILFISFFSTDTGYLAGATIGGVMGFMQWLLLRKELDWAGWWIPVSVLGWTTGLVVMPGMLTSGALPGALTGLTLMILFKYSEKRTG